MLTRDLVRYKVVEGAVEPHLLRPTPAIRSLAEAVLAHWSGGIGETRQVLDDSAAPVLHRARSLVVARGLQKLVVDACRFDEPTAGADDRWAVLTASALALAHPAASAAAHVADVATSLERDAAAIGERLYADLPHLARLQSAPEWSPEGLIERYNRALVQGLLLGAERLTVEVRDADTGRRRQLLKALRFQRLLAEVAIDRAGVLAMTISGPGSVLDQANRYGLQLANFLPALACATDWDAAAQIRLPREKRRLSLRVGSDTGLIGETRFLGHVPEELSDLGAVLGQRLDGWAVDLQPGLLPLPSGELVVPDLGLVDEQRRSLAVECFHRWHAAPLRRRLQQVSEGHAPGLILAVDRALLKKADAADLADHPMLAERGCLFSSFPTPRPLLGAIKAAVKRLGW